MAAADGAELVAPQLAEELRQIAAEMPGQVRRELLSGGGPVAQLGAEDAVEAEQPRLREEGEHRADTGRAGALDEGTGLARKGAGAAGLRHGGGASHATGRGGGAWGGNVY